MHAIPALLFLLLAKSLKCKAIHMLKEMEKYMHYNLSGQLLSAKHDV